MDNQLQLFKSEEFGKLEVLMIDGNPYFPATQCATILGYAKPNNAVARHCHDSLKRGVMDSLGRTQETIFIPEWDLYRLIFRSKLPAAVRFEQFVVKEILPSIRKHGAYITTDTLAQVMKSKKAQDSLIQKLHDESKKNETLQSRIDTLSPKVRYCDAILLSQNAMPVSLIAKDYGMSAITFNRLLAEMRIQYKMNDTWLLHQEYADMGYTKSRTYHVNETTTVMQTHWTQRGRYFLYDKLALCGILPLGERGIVRE